MQAYLEEKYAWILIEKNVYFREGEIDLIMLDVFGLNGVKGELIFVEVKARRNEKYGAVVESLTSEKVRRMKRAILRWRARHQDHRLGRLLFVGVLMGKDGHAKIEEFPIE